MAEEKDIYNLPIHRVTDAGPLSAIRVPGGWIYYNEVGGMAFVPWTKISKAPEMREALEAVRVWRGIGIGSIEHFDIIGKMFRKETGFERPGKDTASGEDYPGQAGDASREWDLWRTRKNREIDGIIMDALESGGE